MSNMYYIYHIIQTRDSGLYIYGCWVLGGSDSVTYDEGVRKADRTADRCIKRLVSIMSLLCMLRKRKAKEEGGRGRESISLNW